MNHALVSPSAQLATYCLLVVLTGLGDGDR